MHSQNRYTAEEVALILQAEGDATVSKRTVNYYAFEKNMFDISTSGKKSFTDTEVDKLRAIRLLKEYTNLTLEQIKKVINTRSLDEVKEMCTERISSISDFYTGSFIKSSASEDVLFCPSPDYLTLSPAKSAEEEAPMDAKPKVNRTIKVDEDITLILSPKVSSEKLAKIVKFIKKLD